MVRSLERESGLAALAARARAPQPQGRERHEHGLDRHEQPLARVHPIDDQPEDPSDLGPIVAQLMADAELNPDMGGKPRGGTGRPNKEI